MQVSEINEEVRDKVSIYGIMNSIWKQKELMIKIDSQKHKLHQDTHKGLIMLQEQEEKIICLKNEQAGPKKIEKTYV